MKIARQGGLHIWNDCPVELSSLLRDCGLKTEKISIYCYYVIPPAIKETYTYEEYLQIWIYPPLQDLAEYLSLKH